MLVVANETVGGDKLIEAIERRGGAGPDPGDRRLPAEQARKGYVIYDDSVRSAARIRLDLTLERLHKMGIEALVRSWTPIRSSRSRMRCASGALTRSSSRPIPIRAPAGFAVTWWSGSAEYAKLPVEHVVVDLREEPVEHALVVANQTVGGRQLIETLERRASEAPHRSRS